MSNVWPYNISPNTNTVYYGYPPIGEAQMRQIIREELQQALHPEQDRPSATVEYVMDGKRYKGTVYLMEEDEEGDED